MYIGLHVKYPFYSYTILMKLEFSRQIFEKILKISNCMKIHRVGAKLFHADRQTDKHDEVNSRFSQFCERALKVTENDKEG